VLNSIASRNDAELALARLRATGLDELVLHPQIGWGAKSVAIPRIAEQLGIGLDAIAFVDDQPFERAEVSFALPKVLCVDAADIVSAVATRPEFRHHRTSPRGPGLSTLAPAAAAHVLPSRGPRGRHRPAQPHPRPRT